MEFSDRELLEIGKKQFEGKNYAKAEELLKRLIQKNKKYADVYHMLGVIYHHHGRFSDAIFCFKRALDINPNYVEATLNLAVLYNDLGQYPKAKKLYTHIRKRRSDGRRPLDPVMKGRLSNMHAMLGDTYRGIGFDSDAIDEYEKALKISPTYADIRTKLGIALREKGKYQQSLKELRRAIKDKPKYLEARLQLGLTEYAGGKKKAAARDWTQVLKKQPGNERAKTYLSLCERK